MFARTERLLLRPAWAEDAPALAAALDPLGIADSGSTVPHPHAPDDARAFVAQPVPPTRPRLLIFARGGRAPELVGGIGLRDIAGGVSLGYWIRPDRWGCGYATEAGHAMLAIADMLGIGRLSASHYLDDPASGAVLTKLGFRPTGDLHLVRGAGRNSPEAAARHMVRMLDADITDEPLAA